MDERYVCPERGRKKFKLAQELQQNVYLYGMTGNGKTSLVKHMLSRKSYDYYSAREAGADQIEIPKDGRKHVAVLDDLHEISGERQRELYAEKLSLLLKRRDIWLILISRCRLPQWLMPFHMEQPFLVIEEEDLQLDRQGQDAYLKNWKLNLSPEKADRIWKAAGGNPLFLRFAAMAGGDVKQAVGDMWNFFPCIIERWETELREFLVEMSVVEQFDAGMAHMATGRGNVQELLKKALETGINAGMPISFSLVFRRYRNTHPPAMNSINIHSSREHIFHSSITIMILFHQLLTKHRHIFTRRF